MALVRVVTLTTMQITQLNQFVDLLTGVMTDQAVTIGNNLTANSYSAVGLTGSAQATRYVGGTTTGAPTSGAHLLGDFAIAQDGFLWICVTAGTPGTWKLGGADLASAAPLALAAAAVVGTSLKAAREDHVHASTGLGVLASAQTWAGLQTMSGGVALGSAAISATRNTSNQFLFIGGGATGNVVHVYTATPSAPSLLDGDVWIQA